MADGDVLLKLRSMAQRLGVSISEVIRRALKEYSNSTPNTKPKLYLTGLGASGGKIKISERTEDLLFEKKQPRQS